MCSLHPIGQRLKPQHIGNMAAAFADHAGDIVLAVAEIADQCAIPFRLFERIEIGALDVLDDRKLQRFAVSGLDDDDRNLVQPGTLGRPPPPFAGDDLIHVGNAAECARDDRLNDAAFAQRACQFIKLSIGKHPPRVARVRLQRRNRQMPLTAPAVV